MPELQKLDRASVGIRHWVVIEDSVGVEITSVEEDLVAHEALEGFMGRGVNAAYVTYVPGGSERALAHSVVADPQNSCLRESQIVRDDGSLHLSAWARTV